MRNLFCLAVLALTGCPPPARYIVADVTATRAPVEGALVAAECGEHHSRSLRTNDEGRARLRIYKDARACSLTVAKPGFSTVETGPVNVCPTATACAPARVELVEALAPPHVAPVPFSMSAPPTRPTPRPSYARPGNQMEVAR